MKTRTLYFRTYHDEGDHVIGFFADSDESAIAVCQAVYLPAGERLSLHRSHMPVMGGKRVARFRGDASGRPTIVR